MGKKKPPDFRDEFGRFKKGFNAGNYLRGKKLARSEYWIKNCRDVGTALLINLNRYRSWFKRNGVKIIPGKGHVRMVRDLSKALPLSDLDAYEGRVRWRVRQGWTTEAILQHLMDGDI